MLGFPGRLRLLGASATNNLVPAVENRLDQRALDRIGIDPDGIGHFEGSLAYRCVHGGYLRRRMAARSTAAWHAEQTMPSTW